MIISLKIALISAIVMIENVNTVQKKVCNMVYVKPVIQDISKKVMKTLIMALLIAIKIRKDISLILVYISLVILLVKNVISQEIKLIIIVQVAIQKILIQFPWKIMRGI